MSKDDFFKSPIVELARQQAQIAASFKSPIAELARQQAQIAASFKSPIAELARQQAQIAASFKSPIAELARQQAQIAASFKSPIAELARQQAQIAASFKSSIAELARQQAEIATSFKLNGGLADIYKILSQLDINEILGAIEEFEGNSLLEEQTDVVSQSLSQSSVYIHELTIDELGQLLDEKINRAYEGKQGFLREVLKDILVSVGSDGAKWVLKTIFLLLYFHMSNYLLANHEIILNSIQENVEEYVDIQKYVKNEGLDKYEYINSVGVTRTETLLREGNSRSAPVIYSDKVKINTVVSILEKKGNWLKVELNLDNHCIEGWIEESKVEKFKKSR